MFTDVTFSEENPSKSVIFKILKDKATTNSDTFKLPSNVILPYLMGRTGRHQSSG